MIEHRLAERCPLLFSWAAPLTAEQRDPSLKAPPPGHTPISRRELAERIIADALARAISGPNAQGDLGAGRARRLNGRISAVPP